MIEEKKKVQMRLSIDPEVAAAANASGNASEWLSNAGKKELERLKKIDKKERK